MAERSLVIIQPRGGEGEEQSTYVFPGEIMVSTRDGWVSWATQEAQKLPELTRKIHRTLVGRQDDTGLGT